MPRSPRKIPFLLAFLAAELVGPGCGAIPIRQRTSRNIPPSSSEPRSLEQEIEHAVNQYRAGKGLRSLIPTERLAQIARAHSEDMAQRGYMAHESPGGRGPADRVRAAGLQYRRMAENVAMARGMEDPVATVVEGWIRSPGHRDNILEAHYTQTGVGIALASDGALYVTQLFLEPPARVDNSRSDPVWCQPRQRLLALREQVGHGRHGGHVPIELVPLHLVERVGRGMVIVEVVSGVLTEVE